MDATTAPLARDAVQRNDRHSFTMTPEQARDTLAQTLARLGVTETALGGVSTTIGRDSLRGPATEANLPAVSLDLDGDRGDAVAEAPLSGPDLVARGVLGRGGMGVVRLVAQRSLERDVAVKTSARNNPRAQRALVREARITGGLEHPNVVPVHALGVDREGSPLLVMKRIEGVSWRKLVHDDQHEAWQWILGGHGDRLRAHLEILMQVSRALDFAHARGVVHRDVKPENVMIGRFGEVYLLDWGVALRLSERDDEPEGIVGTPGYLAPEMVRGDPRLIDVHTDVYLLGATLYEVLAKRPPHEATNALAALVSSLVGEELRLPDEAPEDLAQLVRDAMTSDPKARLPSAESFRAALAQHLRVREADLLAAEGRAALERADRIIAASGAEAPEAYPALIEARFALTAKLRVRSDREARAALDRCLVRLADREVAHRSPGGARTILADMSDVPPELAARVDALEKALAVERQAADDRERARREADSSFSFHALTRVLAVVMAIMAIVLGFVVSGGASRTIDGRGALVIWAAALSTLVGAGFLARRQILRNARTRTLGAFLLLVFLTPFGLTILSVRLGAEMYERSAYSWVASAAIALLGELAVLRQIWPCAVVYVVGAIAIVVAPDWAHMVQPAVLLTNALLLVRALRLDALRTQMPPN